MPLDIRYALGLVDGAITQKSQLKNGAKAHKDSINKADEDDNHEEQNNHKKNLPLHLLASQRF